MGKISIFRTGLKYFLYAGVILLGPTDPTVVNSTIENISDPYTIPQGQNDPGEVKLKFKYILDFFGILQGQNDPSGVKSKSKNLLDFCIFSPGSE